MTTKAILNFYVDAIDEWCEHRSKRCPTTDDFCIHTTRDLPVGGFATDHLGLRKWSAQFRTTAITDAKMSTRVLRRSIPTNIKTKSVQSADWEGGTCNGINNVDVGSKMRKGISVRAKESLEKSTWRFHGDKRFAKNRFIFSIEDISVVTPSNSI